MQKCIVSRYASAYTDRQLCLQNEHECISAEVDHLQQHIFVRTYTCIPRYEHWYACMEVYCTIRTNMHWKHECHVWMYADRLDHERHLQQHILVFLPTYMHPKYKYALYECMDVCRSSQPRAPSLPGADLGSGTHHATTLTILSHCQHADADGADQSWWCSSEHCSVSSHLQPINILFEA